MTLKTPTKETTKNELPELQNRPINWEVVYQFILANPVVVYKGEPPLNPVRLWWIMQDPETPKHQVEMLLRYALRQGFDIYKEQK